MQILRATGDKIKTALLKTFHAYTQLNSEQKTRLTLALLIFFTGFFLRFAYLKYQGFWDSDEYASYAAMMGQILQGDLSHFLGGNMWGRPFGFLTSYFFMKIFGFTPYAIHIKSALLGFCTIVIGYIIGEKHLCKNAGLFAAALIASSYELVYYSRTMKMTAPSMFFCALAIWILFEIIDNPGTQRHALCGLMLGFMLTTHPATIPMTATILLMLAIVTIAKEKKIGQSLNYGLLTLLGLLTPIIGCELFYLSAKILPWWHTAPNIDYMKFLFFYNQHGPANLQHVKPHISSFLGEITNNGKALLYLIGAGQAISLIALLKGKIKPFLLSMIFWLPILIYTYILHPVVAERNIFTSLFPGCLIGGYFFAYLINQTKLTSFLKSFAIAITSFALLTYGIPKSLPIIKNASAAQNIYDYIGSQQASMTRPSKSVYQWEHYYFTNSSLSVDNWSDVLKNFLLNRANYLIQLTPSWTNATGFEDTQKYATQFRTAESHGGFSVYYLYNPKQLEKILKDKFSLTKIKSINLKRFSSLTGIQKSQSNKYMFEKKAKQIIINIPTDANLLAISGRIPLNPDIGESINIAIGNKSKPTLYTLKSFSPHENGALLPNEKETNIFYVWELAGKKLTQLTLSPLLTKRLSLRALLRNFPEAFAYFFATDKKQIKGFSVTFYHIPNKYLPKNMPSI